MRVVYRVARGCTYCNTCIFECPVDAIEMTRDGAVIDAARCTGCGTCYDNCASQAIERVEAPEDKGDEA